MRKSLQSFSNLFVASLISVNFLQGEEAPYRVVGIGSAVMDLLIHVEDSFLEEHVEGKKGGCSIIEEGEFQRILHSFKGTPKIVPGGSGANTIKGLSLLGESCAYYTDLGEDMYGEHFIRNLKNTGVVEKANSHPDFITMKLLSMITPDGQRTMRVICPKVNATLDPELFHKDLKLIYLEGYQFRTSDYVQQTVEIAKENSIPIAMDLSSFEVVQQCKEEILKTLARHVAIVFANEDEVQMLTGLSPEEGCVQLQTICPLVIMMRGEKGCAVVHEGHMRSFPAFPAKVVDTTGAGDLFISGFLYAYLQKYPLEICAKLGNRLGNAAVEIVGAELSKEQWDKIKLFIENEIHSFPEDV